MSQIRSGELRDIIKIQRRPDTKDASGHQSGPWEDVFTNLHVDIRDMSGREYVNNFASVIAIHPELNVTIIMRGFSGWRTQIQPDMRAVSSDDRVFDIHGIVNPDGKNIELQIGCVEIVK